MLKPTDNYLRIHGSNSLSYPWCDKVGWRFLHCYLSSRQRGHLGEVPGTTSGLSRTGGCTAETRNRTEWGRLPGVSARIVGRIVKEVNLLSYTKYEMCTECGREYPHLGI